MKAFLRRLNGFAIRILPKRAARWIFSGFILTALAAPLLAGHDPLVARVNGEWLFPAFSHSPYVELPTDSQTTPRRKTAIDWRTFPCEWKLLPFVCYSPTEHDLQNLLRSPFDDQYLSDRTGASVALPATYRHWLGTTATGCDVAALLIHGCRTSLLIGLLSTLLAGTIGILLGTFAGWFGNHRLRILGIRIPADRIHTAITVSFATVPRLVLILVVAVILPRGILPVALLIGITGWTDLSRLTRTGMLQVRTAGFIAHANIAGVPALRLLLYHALPNLSALTTGILLSSFAHAVVTESALTFLGAGLPSDIASWGQLVAAARSAPDSWWLIIFPAAALSSITYSLSGTENRFQRLTDFNAHN